LIFKIQTCGLREGKDDVISQRGSKVDVPIRSRAVRGGEFGHRKNNGLHLEKFFQPRTELRVLQPSTEFSERIWVNKKNISK
jgi:hypothetical protein